MHIIKKPKQYKLPFLIQKRIASQQSQTKIPEVYFQSKIQRKKSKSLFSNEKTITYIKQNDLSQYRPLIRKSISMNMNFQHNQKGSLSYFPQQIIEKLKEPVKAIPYNTQKYQYIYKNIKQIFADDIQISKKDILAAYGSVTQSFYVFFTSVYYQPFSLCCQSLIYMKIQNNQPIPSNRIAKLETSLDFFQRNNNIINRFKCSKCQQTVLNIIRKSEESFKISRSIGRQALQMDAQRQKISMSIVIASGKFKKMRINEITEKETSIEYVNREANQQNNFSSKSKTLPFRYKKDKIF